MSITSDIRTYADTALEQGKQVVGTAQTQFTDAAEAIDDIVTDFVSKVRGSARSNVSDLGARANDTVSDLRAQAERAVNLEVLRSAVEPYLAQARRYGATVGERAEGLYDGVRKDKRVATLLATAESVTGVVVETVQDRVIRPVGTLTGRGTTTVRPPAAGRTTRPAAKRTMTKPAATRAAAKRSPATKATATAPATTATRTARQAPAGTATRTARQAPATTATRNARQAPATKATAGRSTSAG